MAKPIAVQARISMSKPDRRLILGDRHGPVTNRPDWLSLDVQVEFELDDTRRVSTREPTFMMGGPLDCSRPEFEKRVRGLIFSEPRGAPPPHSRGDARDELPQLVAELDVHGIESTIETLSGLPLTVVLDDEVAQRLSSR